MKQEIYSLNYLKGICAILVILIHTHLIGKVSIVPVYRCAVPLFFMISGYFLMGTDGEWHREKIGRYLKKMLKIWVVTDLVYIIFSEFIFADYSVIHSHSNILLLIVKEVTVGGQFCYPLWYITAYVWALVILRFWKCKYNKVNICIIGILVLWNVLFGTYSFLLPFEVTDSYISNNALTSALPFVVLGGFLKLYMQRHKKQVAIKGWLILLVLCYAELAFLYIMNSRNGDVFLATPILSSLIFMWFVNHPNFGQTSWIRVIGKNYSLNIYLLQVLVIWMVGACCAQFGLNVRNYEFLIVLPITIFVCYVLGQLGKALRGLQKLHLKSC